ncbi:YopX family protein [Campylobacter jejuni]
MKLQDFDFRIWNNETERYETNKPLISLLMIDVLTRVAYLNGNKFEIELWTGYCDKNGKNIYENDIVKVEDNGNASIFKVGFSNNMGFSASLQTEAILSYQLKILASKGFEIIGNIHENAELLNENKPS